MDRLFETEKAKAVAEKAKETSSAPSEQKLNLRLNIAEEKTLQFEEQTFSVEEKTEGEKPELDLPESKADGLADSQKSYLSSFENKTVAEFMREDAERQAAELNVLQRQKESLSESAFDPNMTIEQFQKSEQKAQDSTATQEDSLPQNGAAEQSENQAKETFQSTQENTTIIEKPNYDLLQEPKKVVKLSKKQEPKKRKFSKKTAGIVLACALAGGAVICVTNAVLIDQMSASYIQIDETYKLNLAKYLKSIYKLDTTKQSMKVLETYPQDLLDAGDLGEKSNWFDRLCNFIGGLFGG